MLLQVQKRQLPLPVTNWSSSKPILSQNELRQIRDFLSCLTRLIMFLFYFYNTARMLLSGTGCNILCTLIMIYICITENSFKRRGCVPLSLNNFSLTVQDHQQVLQENQKNLVFLIITGLKVSI